MDSGRTEVVTSLTTAGDNQVMCPECRVSHLLPSVFHMTLISVGSAVKARCTCSKDRTVLRDGGICGWCRAENGYDITTVHICKNICCCHVDHNFTARNKNSCMPVEVCKSGCLRLPKPRSCSLMQPPMNESNTPQRAETLSKERS